MLPNYLQPAVRAHDRTILFELTDKHETDSYARNGDDDAHDALR